MDEVSFEQTLTRISEELCHRYKNSNQLMIMGMATRGVPLAKRISKKIVDSLGIIPFEGALDASFYRDDFHFRIPLANPTLQITEIPDTVENTDIILVDDVLYTGRSVRSALEAIFDMGRPRSVCLVVLVDRGHRQLPIQADIAGLTLNTAENEEVRVQIKPEDSEDSVWLVEVKK
jgi:pyrimidine operon attenuation protein/uracil phosphoribosyltransferase